MEMPIELNTEFGKFDCWYIKLELQEGVCLRHKGISERLSKTPLLRIQSSCLFSESLHTKDCDCALQLHEALRRVAARGGIVVYLYEEGRGAGLKTKIDAIRIQQQEGVRSKEAYERLKIVPEQRISYKLLDRLLDEVWGDTLGWIILTNNPVKEQLIKQAGVNVKKREQLVCGTDDNLRFNYLQEKVNDLGHEINL